MTIMQYLSVSCERNNASKPFDPILIYMPQGMTMEGHTTLAKDSFANKFQMKL